MVSGRANTAAFARSQVFFGDYALRMKLGEPSELARDVVSLNPLLVPGRAGIASRRACSHWSNKEAYFLLDLASR